MPSGKPTLRTDRPFGIGASKKKYGKPQTHHKVKAELPEASTSESTRHPKKKSTIPFKKRDMEDTWAPEELHRSMKDIKDDKKKSRDRDKDRERPREKDKERDRDKRDRDRDKDREKKRDKDRDHEKDRDREKRDKDRDKDRDRKREKDRDKDREHRRDKDRNKENGTVEEKRHRDRDKERDKEKSRDKDRDKPRDRDRDKDRDRKDRERDKPRDKDGDRERRKRDEEDDKKKRHRDDDRRKHREKDEKKDRGESRSKRDEDGERRRRHHDDDEERRRKERHERRKQDEKGGEDDDRDRRRRERKDREAEEKKSKRHEEKKKEEKKEEKKWTPTFGQPSLSHPSGRNNLLQKASSSSCNSIQEEKHLSLDKKHSSASEITSEEKPAEDEYNYDDDDFEDYDDDFEDEDEDNSDDDDEPQSSGPVSSSYKSRGEMDDILKAMDEENDRLVRESRQERVQAEPSSSQQARPKTGKRNFINFVSAKQRTMSNQAQSKARRRGRELLQIIELDKTGYDMFDLPPVKEYDMYIRSFGQSNTKQAYVQTNDDNIDRDIQTEEIETTEKWCQHPPEDPKGCGGVTTEEKEEEDYRLMKKKTDSVRFNKFIEAASQVILVLMEEERAELNSDSNISRKKSNIILSEDFSELSRIPPLQGRYVVHSTFSPTQSNMLLTAHSSIGEFLWRSGDEYKEEVENKPAEDNTKAPQGILCVWNVNQPSQPQKILVCESSIRCCCFSPTKPTLAFAGMNEGSVCVWDLREQSSLHRTVTVAEQEFMYRYPTYNTAGVLQNENHESGIVSIVPIIAMGESTSASLEVSEDSDVESGMNFQLATLEDDAIVNLWVVAELSNSDAAGSPSDLGLAPGGKIKLLKSSSIMLESPLRDARMRTAMRAFEMQLLPADPSHFYVGTDTGCIIHGVRYGGKAPPKAYRQEIESLTEVTAIDFSPFPEPVFLAGCSDGSLRLYSIRSEQPLIIWPYATEGRPIQMVRWCRSRPSIFFVLDTNSLLYIWDLQMNDAVPLKQERVSDQRITSFCLSNDHSATGLGLPGRKPQMVVCLATGETEVHTISQQFSALMAEEVDQMADYLARIM